MPISVLAAEAPLDQHNLPRVLAHQDPDLDRPGAVSRPVGRHQQPRPGVEGAGVIAERAHALGDSDAASAQHPAAIASSSTIKNRRIVFTTPGSRRSFTFRPALALTSRRAARSTPGRNPVMLPARRTAGHRAAGR